MDDLSIDVYLLTRGKPGTSQENAVKISDALIPPQFSSPRSSGGSHALVPVPQSSLIKRSTTPSRLSSSSIPVLRVGEQAVFALVLSSSAGASSYPLPPSTHLLPIPSLQARGSGDYENLIGLGKVHDVLLVRFFAFEAQSSGPISLIVTVRASPQPGRRPVPKDFVFSLDCESAVNVTHRVLPLPSRESAGPEHEPGQGAVKGTLEPSLLIEVTVRNAVIGSCIALSRPEIVPASPRWSFWSPAGPSSASSTIVLGPHGGAWSFIYYGGCKRKNVSFADSDFEEIDVEAARLHDLDLSPSSSFLRGSSSSSSFLRLGGGSSRKSSSQKVMSTAGDPDAALKKGALHQTHTLGTLNLRWLGSESGQSCSQSVALTCPLPSYSDMAQPSVAQAQAQARGPFHRTHSQLERSLGRLGQDVSLSIAEPPGLPKHGVQELVAFATIVRVTNRRSHRRTNLVLRVDSGSAPPAAVLTSTDPDDAHEVGKLHLYKGIRTVGALTHTIDSLPAHGSVEFELRFLPILEGPPRGAHKCSELPTCVLLDDGEVLDVLEGIFVRVCESE